MAGIKDLFRSRSRSRPPKGEASDAQEAPPLPPPPSEPPATGPPPLFRPDSNIVGTKKQQPQLVDGIGGSSYEALESGELPQTGTYPLHGNAPVTMPTAPPDPGTSAYDNVYEGAAPEKGTYPLHGNVPARVPSERSRTPERAASRGSQVARRRSGPRVPSANRRSIPPGTAVTADEPIVPASPTSPTNATRSVAPVQTNYSTTRTLDSAPNVPAIPGEYKGSTGATNGLVNGVDYANRHERGFSSASKASRTSTSSRTPIADEFAPSSWYGRAGTEAPTWSEVHGEAISTDTPRFSMEANSGPGTSSYQTEIDEMSSRLAGPQVNGIPDESSRQLPERLSEDMPGSARGGSKRHSRGLSTNSESKKLPIPSQLKDAPWNKMLHTGLTPTEEKALGDLQVNGVPNGVPKDVPKTREVAPQVNGVPPPVVESTPPAQVAPPVQAPPPVQTAPPVQTVPPVQAPPPVQTAPPVQTVPPVQTPSPVQSQRSLPPATRLIGTPPMVNGGTYRHEKLPLPGDRSRDSVQSFVQAEVRQGQAPKTTSRAPLVENSSEPISMDGIVDLRNTADTTVHEVVAPAVTHEHVMPTVHSIREEQVTREIHNHHVFHRILPIVDVQVLPAKHFVPDASGNGFVEIPASEVPGRSEDGHQNQNWVIAETVSRETIPISDLPRHFTARQFPGTEGDYREWVGEDGVKRSETTWVHPPVISGAGYKSGITVPLWMDEP